MTIPIKNICRICDKRYTQVDEFDDDVCDDCWGEMVDEYDDVDEDEERPLY